jgi:hypothetical protein
VALAMLAVVSLAVLNPDGFIAAHNIQRWQVSGRLDTGYLAGLSPDAVAAVRVLPQPLRGCVLGGIARQLGTRDWRSWNASRAAARDELAGQVLVCGE